MAIEENKIGIVKHYYSKIGVGTILLDKPLKVGDSVHILGHSTDITQSIDEMQFDHKNIGSGKKGQEVGVKLKDVVRENDEVFLV